MDKLFMMCKVDIYFNFLNMRECLAGCDSKVSFTEEALFNGTQTDDLQQYIWDNKKVQVFILTPLCYLSLYNDSKTFYNLRHTQTSLISITRGHTTFLCSEAVPHFPS